MSVSSSDTNGPTPSVGADEAIKRMSRMMLEGWAMTGTICPLHQGRDGSVPLLRDRQGRHFCSRCNHYIQFENNSTSASANRGSSEPAPQEQQQQQLNRNTRTDETANASNDTGRQLETVEEDDDESWQPSALDNAEAEFRSHITNVISRKMGPLLLQGYRMISDTCDVPGCSAPILEKHGEKTCVICPNWKPVEQRGPGYFAQMVLNGNDYKRPPSSLEQYVSTTTVRNSAVADQQLTGNDQTSWESALNEVDARIRSDETSSVNRNGEVPTDRTNGLTTRHVNNGQTARTGRTHDLSALGDVVVRDAPTNWMEMTDAQLFQHARGNRLTPQRPPPQPTQPRITQRSLAQANRDNVDESVSSDRVSHSTIRGTAARDSISHDTLRQSIHPSPEEHFSRQEVNEPRMNLAESSSTRWSQFYEKKSAGQDLEMQNGANIKTAALEAIDSSIGAVSQRLRDSSSELSGDRHNIKSVADNIDALARTLSSLAEARAKYSN